MHMIMSLDYMKKHMIVYGSGLYEEKCVPLGDQQMIIWLD